MTRGIVIGARIDLQSGFSMTGSVEIQDLLRWLLYWDEITYTGISMDGASITGNQPQDVLFLEAEGIFRTELVDIQSLDLACLPSAEPGIQIMGLSGNQFAIAAAAARLQLSQQLSESSGDIWTIGQSGGESLLLPGANDSADLGHVLITGIHESAAL